jgi:hypothetical protein
MEIWGKNPNLGLWPINVRVDFENGWYVKGNQGTKTNQNQINKTNKLTKIENGYLIDQAGCTWDCCHPRPAS